MFRLITLGASLLASTAFHGCGCDKKVDTSPKNVDKLIKGCEASKQGLNSAIFLDPTKFAEWVATPAHAKALSDPNCKKLGEVVSQKLLNDLDAAGCEVTKAGLTLTVMESKDKKEAWLKKHSDLMEQSQCVTGYPKFAAELEQYQAAFLEKAAEKQGEKSIPPVKTPVAPKPTETTIVA